MRRTMTTWTIFLVTACCSTASSDGWSIYTPEHQSTYLYNAGIEASGYGGGEGLMYTITLKKGIAIGGQHTGTCNSVPWWSYNYAAPQGGWAIGTWQAQLRPWEDGEPVSENRAIVNDFSVVEDNP